MMSARGKSKSISTIIQCLDDPKLFGRVEDFSKPSWSAWRTLLKASFGLAMTDAELTIFTECTGRDAAPTAPVREGWWICGRRAGKSRMVAIVAAYLACFHEHTLSVGEVGTVLIVAQDRRSARTIFGYLRDTLHAIPVLKQKIIRETREEIELDNGVCVEVVACSIGAPRGRTIIAALLDEISVWHTDDAENPDVEVINSVKPGMATQPHAMMLVISSPYAKRGALWQARKRFWAKDDPQRIVWQAATLKMNPTVPLRVIEAAFEEDSAKAAAEYSAQFRSDIASFVTQESVYACVTEGVRERAPESGISYHAFVDPAGGSGEDSMTIAIGHRDAKSGMAVLDAIRERRPKFNPDAVVAEFAALLKTYRVTKITGDHWGGEFVRQPFRNAGILYEKSDRTKSVIYLESLAALNSEKLDLLDDQKMIVQICGLERRTARGGKDSIDHSPGAHDDVANAVLGVLLLCGGGKSNYIESLKNIGNFGDASIRRIVENEREVCLARTWRPYGRAW